MTQGHTLTDGPRPRVGRVRGAFLTGLYDVIADAPDGLTVGIDVALRRYGVGLDLVNIEIKIDEAPYTLTGIVTRHNACEQASQPPAGALYRLRYDDGRHKKTVTVRGHDSMLYEAAGYSIPDDRRWLLYRWISTTEAILDDEIRTCNECGTTAARPEEGWSDTRDAGWVYCDYCGSQLYPPATGR